MLLFDREGKERVRIEGYLPHDDFLAALESGLGRIAFVHKQYADAERWYNDVITGLGETHSAPGAMYWRAVLGRVAEDLRAQYPSSVWASKSIPWLPTGAQKEVA